MHKLAEHRIGAVSGVQRDRHCIRRDRTGGPTKRPIVVTGQLYQAPRFRIEQMYKTLPNHLSSQFKPAGRNARKLELVLIQRPMRRIEPAGNHYSVCMVRNPPHDAVLVVLKANE
jgi:hypothetical protein